MRFFRSTIIPVICLFACGVFSAQAKLYKWVDNKGQVHFGDKIPIEYLARKHEELNASGQVVKQYPAAETPEQRAEKRRLEKLKKQAELVQKKKQRRDRVLLDTYTTERDLVMARDSRLDAVGSQIKLAQSIVNDSIASVKALNARIKRIQASGRKVPKDIFLRLRNEQQQIEMHKQVVIEHKNRRQDIEKQFNGYIKRFRVLKAEEQAQQKKRLQENEL